METTGRKSAADLAVVRITASDRPQPPECLTPWQADLWRAVTSTKPADWFTDDSLPLLEAYVEAALTHRISSSAAKRFTSEMLSDPEMLRQYDRVIQIQTRASSSLSQLAMKMRLSQSSRYGARGASGAHERTAKTAKPWE